MKKTIAIISLIIAFFVIYFLQTNFFTWFTINGIMPNLFVILVLFIGLFAGRKLHSQTQESSKVICNLLAFKRRFAQKMCSAA